uniref:F-box/FBD/LRR-repeat protein At3g52680-like n=1 Tax=Erigeron canadensis TaxID=72917 RepID=UPI001CB9B9BF|nr:F-box/FBD/LRR-repeat protein At3g52680-like [Erigeron canadensis]
MENVQVKEEEGEQNQQHPKRMKTQQEDPEEKKDRISSLPDGLIIDEILGRLRDTKHAIRTGALSKRWQHLWPLVPVLYFSYYNSCNKKHTHSDNFCLSVDKTLTQCRPHLKKLNKFHVSTSYNGRFELQLLDKWIRFATDCDVQQLYLDFYNLDWEHQFVLKDDSFFINSHFTHLRLGGCIFDPTGPIIWNNLTHLSISNGKLDEHLIANMLSGSPLLGTLRLEECYGYRRLDITSKSVKSLVLSGYSAYEHEVDDILGIIEINAPYILSLTIQDDLFLTKLSLLNVSSLTKAGLDYTKTGYYGRPKAPKREQEEMLKRLILNLRHVKELKIGIECHKALYRLEAKGFNFPSNLKVQNVMSPVSSDSDSMDYSDNESSDDDSSDSDSMDYSDNESSDDDSSDSDSDSVESGDSEELVLD